MTKVISLLNLKGGVGKSTSAVNISAGLNQKGYKVLIIDTDPQANASKLLGVISREEYPSIDDAYRCSLKEGNARLPIVHREGGVDVVPSCISLSTLEVQLSTALKKDERLDRMLSEVKSAYDFVFIDCPPSLNVFVINALMASDCVIVPVEAHALALQGMEDVISLIGQVQVFKPSLSILGLLLTKFDQRTSLSRQVGESVRAAYGERVFKTHIRYNITAAESPLQGKHLYEYAPGCHSAVDYLALCDEITERLRKAEEGK